MSGIDFGIKPVKTPKKRTTVLKADTTPQFTRRIKVMESIDLHDIGIDLSCKYKDTSDQPFAGNESIVGHIQHALRAVVDFLWSWNNDIYMVLSLIGVYHIFSRNDYTIFSDRHPTINVTLYTLQVDATGSLSDVKIKLPHNTTLPLDRLYDLIEKYFLEISLHNSQNKIIKLFKQLSSSDSSKIKEIANKLPDEINLTLNSQRANKIYDEITKSFKGKDNEKPILQAFTSVRGIQHVHQKLASQGSGLYFLFYNNFTKNPREREANITSTAQECARVIKQVDENFKSFPKDTQQNIKKAANTMKEANKKIEEMCRLLIELSDCMKGGLTALIRANDQVDD